MRSISTLATLLLGLAVVFLAPAAKADCPHGTKFIHPHCNVVEPPSGGIGVLRDAGGNIIGKVVGITRTSVTILFDAAGQTVSATVEGGRGFRTAGFNFGAIPGAGDVLFDNADCTGGAWLEVTNSDFFDEFRVAMIVGEENIDSDERRLYLPDTTVPSAPHTVASRLFIICSPFGVPQTLDLVPALLIDPDLHTTFPKPYTLDLN